MPPELVPLLLQKTFYRGECDHKLHELHMCQHLEYVSSQLDLAQSYLSFIGSAGARRLRTCVKSWGSEQNQTLPSINNRTWNQLVFLILALLGVVVVVAATFTDPSR